MDKEVKNQLAILNLAGELSTELSNYFSVKQILVVNPETDKSVHKWSHILTQNVQDFNLLRQNYKTIENDVKLISLTPVDDLQLFVASNGKLILDEVWLKGSFGGFILDKFFQEYGGITLGDNYPAFKEKGSFNITNPFNTGEYLDRLVHSAYQEGMSGLSIKTFFDHLVMYLTGLKTQDKIGMPIEVMYGYFEDVFALQLHFYTKDLILEDLTSSLSNNISKKAEKYLLNIAVQSSDFFDFTLLSEVNKTVITGLWSKDERIKIENRGLLLNELNAAASLTSYPTEGVTSFQSSSQEIADFSDKVVLSSGLEKDNFQTTVKDSSLKEEEVVQFISGSDIEEDIINVIKGNFTEEEGVFKISGSEKFDVDKFALRICAGLEDKGKGNEVFKLKSLLSGLPDSIKGRFNEFAFQLNKSVDQLNEEDLRKFKEQEIPRILKESTKRFDAENMKVKTLVDGPGAKARNLEAESTLELQVNGLKVENATLKAKMKTLATEVKILQDSKVQMALIQSKAAEAAASSETSIQEAIVSQTERDLKNQIIEKMIAQKTLNEEDTKKLAELMEKESKLLTSAKENVNLLKRLEIESTQKEAMFTQELEKQARMLRAKDLVLQKTKESLTKLLGRKDLEVSLLNERLKQASQTILASQNQAQRIRDLEKQVINHEKMIEIYKAKILQKPASQSEDNVVKDENKRLIMTNNQMKNKIEAMKKEVFKFQDRMSQDSKVITLLKADKVNLEQQIKKSSSDDDKKEVAQILENQNLEKELKQLRKQQEQMASDLQDSHLRQKGLETKLSEALKNQKKENVADTPANGRGKTAHLENNVRKLSQDLMESRNQTAEIKKEAMKLRQEKTAVQNLLDQTKKELDKLKDAAPKKQETPGKVA